MIITALKTKVYAHKQELFSFITESVPRELMVERVILVITSKIVSIAENRIIVKQTREGTPEYKDEKKRLIESESERYFGETLFGVYLTLTQGILIPSAGIDESNSQDANYILFTKNAYESAQSLCLGLKKYYGLEQFGIIITDSHTTPLRKGVTGIGLAHFGFKATRDLVGQADLYGRTMKMTHVNVLDALSAAAVYEMGETNDACPLAVIADPKAEFTDTQTIKGARDEIQIAPEADLYGSLFLKNL